MKNLKNLNEFNIFSDLPEEKHKPDINDIQEGDQVVLHSMPEDKDPIKIGTTGIVLKIQPSLNMIYVDWEDGRTLNLLYDVDDFSVISNPNI